MKYLICIYKQKRTNICVKEKCPYMKNIEPMPVKFSMLVPFSDDKCPISPINMYFCMYPA